MHWSDVGTWGWGGWLASTVMMLIFWGVLITAIVLILRRASDARPYDADRILDERFARGEIDEDEYLHRRRALRS